MDFDRYERHMIIDGIGETGQNKLKNSGVLVVGAGGLGSPVIMYLAAAGVGRIGIIDCDAVEISNLNRQIIHDMDNIGKNKAASAAEYVKSYNPDVQVVVYEEAFDEKNAGPIIKEYDFIIDAVDNYITKYLINDTCVRLEKPYCHGGVLRFQGQAMTYVPEKGPCLRCVFEDVPKENEVEHAKNVGVMGAAVGVIGSVQALEAIKYITGAGELLTGKMFIFDGFSAKSRVININSVKAACPVCGFTHH